MASSFLRFLDQTQRLTTVGRTPLDEESTRRRDLHLTTHNTHNRQTSMLPVRFEPTISAGERPHTYALDRAATGTGVYVYIWVFIIINLLSVLITYLFVGHLALLSVYLHSLLSAECLVIAELESTWNEAVMT